MPVRYVFTGNVYEDGSSVYGAFIKAASWGKLSKLMHACGMPVGQTVFESEKNCINMVAAIQRGNAAHGDVKDLEGYREAWQMIRAKKKLAWNSI